MREYKVFCCLKWEEKKQVIDLIMICFYCKHAITMWKAYETKEHESTMSCYTHLRTFDAINSDYFSCSGTRFMFMRS